MGTYRKASDVFGNFFSVGDPAHPPYLHRNPWFWGWVIAFAFPTMIQFSGMTRQVPDPPEVVAELPDFSLVDQNGEAFTRADLQGRVHITAFFFASCTTICPRIMAMMKGLEDKLEEQAPYAGYGDEIRLLAITVDPKRDTPEVLREQMAAYDLDPTRWTLLTGEREAVHALVTGGFKLIMGDGGEVEPGVFDIAHSNRVAIVDGDGGVRGFYGIEPVGNQVSLAGYRMETDYDGPDAIRGWANIVWKHQNRPR